MSRHRSRRGDREEPSRTESAGARRDGEVAFLLERHADEWKTYSSRVQNYSVFGLLLLCHTFLVFYRPAALQLAAVARQTEDMSRQRAEIERLEDETHEVEQSLARMDGTTSDLKQMGDPETAQIKFESVGDLLGRTAEVDTNTRRRAIELGLGIAREQAEETCGELSQALDEESTVDSLRKAWLAKIDSYDVGDDDIGSIYFGRVMSDTFEEAASESGFDAIRDRMDEQIEGLEAELKSKRESLKSLEESLVSLQANIDRAEATLNNALPTWANGIVDARAGVRFFPIALVSFACWLAWLSWRARVHFDHVRHGQGLENLTRTSALASNTWTVVYRGSVGTAMTIGVYLVVTGTLLALFELTRGELPATLVWSGRLALWTACLAPSIAVALDHRARPAPAMRRTLESVSPAKP